MIHQLRLLARHGVTRVVVCVGYLGEQIERRIGLTQFGIKIGYAYDGTSPLGTLGAIRQALPALGDRFLILYGDTYLRIDYAATASEWRQSALLGLMTVLRNRGRWDASNAEFDGRRVTAYDKRAPSERMQWIDYGLGGLRRRRGGPGRDRYRRSVRAVSRARCSKRVVRIPCQRTVLRDRLAGCACRNQRLSTLPVRLVDRVWLDAALVRVQMLAGVARRRGARLVGGRTVRNNDRVRMGTAVFGSAPPGERGRSRAPRTPSRGAAARLRPHGRRYTVDPRVCDGGVGRRHPLSIERAVPIGGGHCSTSDSVSEVIGRPPR